ncbi:MAG: hypothetical protein MPJ78_11885 [Hyphomicrobiaceae bacterium]|nr:hypothetical protein [Hyphomicrobiaceae bacterium]
MRIATWLSRLSGFSIAILLTAAVPATAADTCAFDKGTFRLVEDDSFTFTMLPPPPGSAAKLAQAEITRGDKAILKGFLTASQGFSRIYFVPDDPALEDSNLALTFLDKGLRNSTDKADYMVIQNLPADMYYKTRELWTEHPINGEIWVRASCP